MARFAAYTSDSSEDEEVVPASSAQKAAPMDEDSSETESETSESESESSSESSSLLTEDLRRDDEEMADERQPNGPVIDKTLIPRAHAIGMDAQRMHVMQSSFFRMPEEAAALNRLNRKHSRDSDGDGLRVDPKQRPSFAHDIELPPHRPSRKYTRVDSSTSAFTGHDHVLVDAGLALGRSFRVGWGPGGVLVHPGSLVAPSGIPTNTTDSSIIYKTSISAFPDQPTLSLKLLQHHLSHSPIRPDDDGVPIARPSPTDLTFSSFVSQFSSTDFSPEAILFRLGQALFDPIELRLANSITADIRTRLMAITRKAALSSWLQQTVASRVDADIKSNSSTSPASTVFTLMTGNQLEKACEVAMDGGYLKLATLISQAGSDLDFQADIEEQLTLWREQRIDAHIEESVRKVYALLAGKVDGPLEGSKGIEPERCKDVDVVEDLDWKRVFGLCLWYGEPLDADISQVFESYTELTKTPSGGRKVATPIPWYSEPKPQSTPSSSQNPSRWKLPTDINLPPDGIYSLIKLYSDPVCSLSQILNPLSFAPSPIDYSIPWHLYIILSRCLRIRDFADRGETGISESEEDEERVHEAEIEGHSPSADLLTASYAFQLEQLGLIQESLFVLLHLEGSLGRKKAIKEMLARNAPALDEWMVRGVVGSLKIPMEWVYEAKALLAERNLDMYSAYELYITAGLYVPAHEIALRHLAADAVIRADYALLGTIFGRFVRKDREVAGWFIGGKVFLDYIEVMTRLPELLAEHQDPSTIPDATQASQTEELVRSIPRLLNLLPDIFYDRWPEDVRTKVALNEMVKGLVGILDKIKLGVVDNIQIPKVSMTDDVARLHIQSLAVGKFLKSIEGAS